MSVLRVPDARGRIRRHAPLASLSWLRVGGPAEVLFEPADEADLAQFLAGLDSRVPVTVVGLASNLLIRDGGIPGVVIRLGRAFVDVRIEGECLEVGAGTADARVSRVAREAGIGGFEFLESIPGSMGGAIRMNAGCHGSETAAVLECVRAIDRQGNIHRATGSDLQLGYRRCGAPSDWIFVRARFQGVMSSPEAIGRTMASMKTTRAESQPRLIATGGSTFRNPTGARAWQLIDQAKCRGLRCGGARVSTKHANFLENDGTATASDLEALGEEVRRRVEDATGTRLEWEICRLGRRDGGLFP